MTFRKKIAIKTVLKIGNSALGGCRHLYMSRIHLRGMRRDGCSAEDEQLSKRKKEYPSGRGNIQVKYTNDNRPQTPIICEINDTE